MLHNNQVAAATTTTAAATAYGTEPTNAATATNATNNAATHFATTTAETNETVVAIVPELSAVVEEEAATTTTADVPAPPPPTATSSSPAAAAAAADENSTSSFAIQMRAQQRQKIKSYHDAKQTAVWRTDSLASNPNSTMMSTICPSDPGSTTRQPVPAVALAYPMKGIIVSSSSSLMQRKSSDSSLTASIPRRVSFPENELVTGYLEPANPWKQICQAKSIKEIEDQYVQSCRKHHTEPLKNVMENLKFLDLHQTRQNLLSLKGVQLTPNDCEAIEELFKTLQYKAIDLSECPLDESCLSALCQIIEYYEAANELDISYNREAMTKRSWDSCAYMVERSQQLQLLNAEGNPITMQGAEHLGRALRSSYLHTLKLEHCGLRGTPLVKLCTGLYHNKMLKELWMGYNDLDCVDAQHIADTLRFNHSIELIDISNNNIRDEGAQYLVQALILQSAELERRLGALRRARAIEVDDGCGSPTKEAEAASPLNAATLSPIPSVPEQDSPPKAEINKEAITEIVVLTPQSCPTKEQETLLLPTTTNTIPTPTNSPGGVLTDLDTDSNDPDDDNTEDTVRTVKNSTQNSSGGQSMLDKLLSMNSDSSGSDEAHSNISTDTLAACCSEDISEISNEIFPSEVKDLSIATTTTTTSTASASSTTATTTTETSTESGAIINSNSSSESTAPPPEETEPTIVVADVMASQAEDSPNLEKLSPNNQKQQQSSQIERNLCDITPSTEAKPVEPNETCVQNNNHNSSSNNNNANNNYNNNTIQIDAAGIPAPEESPSGCSNSSPIYEVTAEESDCINGAASNGVVSGASSRPLDVNKNANVAGDDFEDTHSTDSAFESASEGDISRHLPDEFSRLSVLLESTRLDGQGDDMAKEMTIETATIASESTECLLVAQEAAVTPSSTPTPKEDATFLAPKVTIAEECLIKEKDESSPSPRPSPTLTPPPPSTSPGGAGIGLRRTESSCAYLNQSTRNRSQSSDSLSSDTSLDGIANSGIAEKLTKNDTLSRRQLADANLEAAQRSPSGLKALTLWNNNLTKNCAANIAELLETTTSLELLNIGKNCLSNDFVSIIKDSLTKNQTLTTLGLQSAHLSAKGIEILSSILTFGGNSKLQRIDIRDNKLEVESLNIIADVLKSNKTLTQIDINDEPKRLTIGSDAHLDYTRVLGTVRSLCSRNEKMQAQELAEKTTANVGSLRNNRCRGGYYLGSRKISLTCHSRPLVDARTGTVTATAAVTTANQLEVKRKATAQTATSSRLRSPGPSPPTISPSSSPNRSRFHVSRVTEVGLPGSSLAQLPPASSCMSIPTISSPGSVGGADSAGALPTSSSLPAMASVSSSTQTIKRLSVSPRSRFHVSRIYEDPKVPVGSRQLPPITPHTPPLDLPPTPMLKSARKAIQASQNEIEASKPLTTTTHGTTNTTTSSVVIIEPPLDDAQPINSTNVQEESESAAGVAKLSPTTTNSSSSSSTSPITSSDITDSSSASSFTSSSSPSYTASKPCPLAVFGDNDITLTKESAAVVALSINPELVAAQPPPPPPASVTLEQQPARARKTSWIANPSAVDKLLTLFNTGTIFQRSSSPESKVNSQAQTAAAAQPPPPLTATNNAQNTNNTIAGSGGLENQGQNQNSSISVTRKTTPPSIWSCNTNSALNQGETGSNAASTSFLESASRHVRDFGKQVFRQNLSFNNSCDLAAAANSNTDGNTLSSVAPGGTTSSSSLSSTSAEMPTSPALSQECNTVHMPSSLKRELKENISPEHTINEETLHTLQKFSRMEDVTVAAATTAAAAAAEDAAELGDIEIVMHSEVVDCLPVAEQQQPQQQQQQQQQQQPEDLAAPQTTV
ncbi:serine-rich adhesin for platelets isoform X2 [Drosophila willistoni]|uniref:serine-rich adhesin for platelets isoform X2 n=1 Tax=Drosophila willistoni TaxID=7260 RepID=UPI000C26D20E|nr:serine-rich adhesin for platelets isoform X2 [Drosophila willistoni]